MSEFKEAVYRTPRTYGSPTGYDREVSHVVSTVASIAERLLMEWKIPLEPGAARDGYQEMELMDPTNLVFRAFDVAETFLRVAEERGHLLEVQDAPEGTPPGYDKGRGRP